MLSSRTMATASTLQLAFLLCVFFVWLKRAQLALKSLNSTPRIEPARGNRSQNSALISVMIPAKNEENNIKACLDSLLGQDYSHVEIMVANDSSSDQTEAVLKSYAERITYINVPPTPPDWTGKNYAIHCLLPYARGDWFLFTDADTLHEGHCLSSVLAHVDRHSLKLLTLIPQCLTKSLVEHIIQPCAMALMGLWFPFHKINDAQTEVYFGNGQFLFINAALYRKYQSHELFKEQFLEDFAIMRQIKQLGEKTECALGTDVFGTRMYDSFKGLWRGWRRIYMHAFEQNSLKLGFHATSLIVFSFIPFLMWGFDTFNLATGKPNVIGIWWMESCLLLLILFIVGRAYSLIRAPKRFACFFPLASVCTAFILFNSFWLALTKRKTKWR